MYPLSYSFGVLLYLRTMKTFFIFLTSASFISHVLGITYQQAEGYKGSQFLDGFLNQAIPDPTNGRV